MKKIFIAALFAGTGILLSCTKEVNPQPTASAIEHSTTPFRKDIGTAD